MFIHGSKCFTCGGNEQNQQWYKNRAHVLLSLAVSATRPRNHLPLLLAPVNDRPAHYCQWYQDCYWPPSWSVRNWWNLSNCFILIISKLFLTSLQIKALSLMFFVLKSWKLKTSQQTLLFQLFQTLQHLFLLLYNRQLVWTTFFADCDIFYKEGIRKAWFSGWMGWWCTS